MINLSSLQSIEAFRNIAEADLKQLALITTEQRFFPGERVSFFQDLSPSIFVIKCGSVDILRVTSDKVTRLISQAQEGDFFGEQAMLAISENSEHAVASLETVVLEIDYERLKILALNNPRLGERINFSIAQSLARRMFRRADKLVEVSQSTRLISLGQMAMIVGHEFNNSLSILGVKLEDLNDKLSNKSFDRMECLQDIATCKKIISRVAQLVGRLKSFGRNTDNDPIVPARVKDLIQEMADFCSQRFETSEVDLRINYPDNEATVQCRPAEISQVMVNLLNNALDAVKSLEDRWVNVEVETTADKVLISVTDSGHGMTKNVLNKLFTPFYTTKELGQGSGLGLYISQKLIESNGGTLTVDQHSPNTRFVIRMPRMKAQNE